MRAMRPDPRKTVVTTPHVTGVGTDCAGRGVGNPSACQTRMPSQTCSETVELTLMPDDVRIDSVEPIEPVDFDTVFVRHFGALVRAVTVVSGDRETAADCVQEAFVRAHARWDRLAGFDDPIAWVRHVALNLARDAQRRRRRGDRLNVRLAADTFDSVDDVADIATAPDAGSVLAAAIAALPRRQREVLALRYIEGMSVAEVAGALGISEGAAKFHLHEGRERLRPQVETLRGGS